MEHQDPRRISTREFASDPLKVKRLVKDGAVVVTNRGVPELVILPYQRYLSLADFQAGTALEALGDSRTAAIEFEVPRAAGSAIPAKL